MNYSKLIDLYSKLVIYTKVLVDDSMEEIIRKSNRVDGNYLVCRQVHILLDE